MTKSSTGYATSATGDSQTGIMPFRFDLLATIAQPSVAMAADMNGKLLEGVAASTKEWGDFLNRRLAAKHGAAAAGCSLQNGRRNAEGLFPRSSRRPLHTVGMR